MRTEKAKEISQKFFHSVDVKKQLGSRLRELRAKKGWSQEECAFRCDLDKTYIASIEQGRRNVSIVNIEKIARAFNMTVSQFTNW
ncbi:MAG: helix-turn-helix transcriptional regulator [Bacteroidota bacterium]